MPDYSKQIDADTLQAAQDWYIRSLKARLGVGGEDGLANPDGSKDNYRGYKPDVELATTRDLDETGNVSQTQSSYDANLDPELYRKDPAAWEKKARESIKSWTIGGDDNQQYVYDPKTGGFVKQWHKDTSDRKAITDAAIAAAAMYGIHGIGEYITAQAAGAATGGAGGNVVDSVLGGAGGDAAATTAADAAAKTAAEQEVARLAAKSAAKMGLGNISPYSILAETSEFFPAGVKELLSNVGQFAKDNPYLTMWGLNTVTGAIKDDKAQRTQDEKNRADQERQSAADKAAAERQKAADEAALERTRANNQAQLDQQNNADRIKREAQQRHNDSFFGALKNNGIANIRPRALTRIDGSRVF